MSSKDAKMKLYHFTCPSRMESIMRLGIFKGDVPIGPVSGFNAPWLTSDPEPANQAWDAGGTKSDCRIEVLIPDEELGNLTTWDEVCAVYDVPEFWREALRKAGGNDGDWYIYQGVIDTSWIVQVTHF